MQNRTLTATPGWTQIASFGAARERPADQGQASN
jgi:hypothetical protein